MENRHKVYRLCDLEGSYNVARALDVSERQLFRLLAKLPSLNRIIWMFRGRLFSRSSDLITWKLDHWDLFSPAA